MRVFLERLSNFVSVLLSVFGIVGGGGVIALIPDICLSIYFSTTCLHKALSLLRNECSGLLFTVKHIFRGYLILAILAIYAEKRENISPPILCTQLNQGSDKNGEPHEYLRYFLYYS